MKTLLGPIEIKHIALVAGLLGAGLCRAGVGELTEPVEQALADGELLSAVIVVQSDGAAETWSAGRVAMDDADVPDSKTPYQIGSITKAFTNLLLAEMVAAGDVRFDTTIGEIVGDEIDFANERIGEISLVELATHSSGLPRLPTNLGAASTRDPYAAFDADRLADALAVVRTGQPLIDRYAYSNLGTGLLGDLLGRIHGEGYAAALTEHVVEPLGLADTGLAPGRDAAAAFSQGEVVPAWTFDALAGAGALWSTGDDLLRLGEAMLGRRDWPLAQEADLNREIVLPEADTLALTRVWHVIETDRGPVYWHNGGTAGHRSFFGFRPATDDVLVLLFSGGTDPTALALAWFGHRPGDFAEAVDETILGQYELAPGAGIGVFERGGTTLAQLSGQVPARLYPAGEDWYALHTADASLRFVREDGRVAAVELVQGGRVQRAARTGDRAAVLDRQEIELSSEALADYAGRYRLAPGAVFTIRPADDGLEAQLTGQPFLPIFARGDDVFFYKAVDAELHFERNEDGAVEALVLHQGGLEQRAIRVD